MTTEFAYPPATLARRAKAWGVHLFTASGAVWGLLSILAIFNGQYRLLFVWVGLAMFADGFDGMLARRYHTKVYAAELDGALLDNILDYLNYVVVAALLVLQARLVPPPFGLPIAALMVLSSAFQFSQVDAKTDSTHEYFFKGFPSYWNMVAVYLLMLNLNPWINLVVLFGCVVLVFVPIKYIYPSRTRFMHKTNLAVALAWCLSAFFMLVLFPHIPGWLVGINLAFSAAYVALSLALTLRNPGAGA
ncbi:MAG: CDP-alcohol phosphatidyltransferase family protein [Chloroflexota bacterium]